MKPSIGIGMIGYKFMGKAHSNAYRQINQFFDLPFRNSSEDHRRDANRPRSEAMAERWGWENPPTIGARLIDDPEIRIVDICSPNNTHHEIAHGRARSGQGRRLRKAAGHERRRGRARWPRPRGKRGQINTVWFNYRRVPAIAFARQLIDEGRIGRVYPLPRSLSAGLDHGPLRSAALAHG